MDSKVVFLGELYEDCTSFRLGKRYIEFGATFWWFRLQVMSVQTFQSGRSTSRELGTEPIPDEHPTSAEFSVFQIVLHDYISYFMVHMQYGRHPTLIWCSSFFHLDLIAMHSGLNERLFYDLFLSHRWHSRSDNLLHEVVIC